MGDRHLDELKAALEQKGWRLISREAGDDYRISGAWRIQRSTRFPPTEIHFVGLDDLRPLPVEQAYACEVKDHKNIGLYFGSMRTFRKALPEFVDALDTLEIKRIKLV